MNRYTARTSLRRSARPRMLVANGAALLLALLTTGGGCPFDTREAVPPETNNIPEECRFSSATAAGDVLVNLEDAFGCETFGVDLFRQSLATDFDFDAPDADPSVMAFVDAWGALVEPREGPVGEFTQHMGSLADGQAVQLTLDAEDGDEVGAEEGFVFEDVPYSLEFFDGANVFSRFEGEADIYVRLSGANFVMYRWVDVDLGFPTMALFWFTGTAGGETG